MNGIVFFLFLNPGADRTRLVMSRLVKDIVVLSPANITLSIAASCAPNPVNLVCEENGVIKVQPDITDVGLLHFSFFIIIVLFLSACRSACHGFSYQEWFNSQTIRKSVQLCTISITLLFSDAILPFIAFAKVILFGTTRVTES